MPAHNRKPTIIEAHRVEIAKRYLRGEPQVRIAEALGITRELVAYDLHAIRERWKQAMLADFDEKVARELAKLDSLESEFWDAWAASKSERQITATKRTRAGEKVGHDEASVRKEQRDGNPAFLAGVLQCIDRRIKLLGLDAPVKVDIVERVRTLAVAAGLDPDDAVEEAQRVLSEARQSGAIAR